MVGINESVLNNTVVESGKGYLGGFAQNVVNISGMVANLTGVESTIALVVVSMIFGISIQRWFLKHVDLWKVVIAILVILYLVGRGIITS